MPQEKKGFTRREFLVGATAAAGTAVLTACGGESEESKILIKMTAAIEDQIDRECSRVDINRLTGAQDELRFLGKGLFGFDKSVYKKHYQGDYRERDIRFGFYTPKLWGGYVRIAGENGVDQSPIKELVNRMNQHAVFFGEHNDEGLLDRMLLSEHDLGPGTSRFNKGARIYYEEAKLRKDIGLFHVSIRQSMLDLRESVGGAVVAESVSAAETWASNVWNSLGIEVVGAFLNNDEIAFEDFQKLAKGSNPFRTTGER